MLKLQQVSEHCYAFCNKKNRFCDSNSGYIDLGGGILIDTQSDLTHARQVLELIQSISSGMPKHVINTHEDIDHVAGNQLFDHAEIIGHRSVPERMKEVADPKNLLKLQKIAKGFFLRTILKFLHPGLIAAGQQLAEDYDFEGIRLVPPTTLFDDRHELELDGTIVELIYVGPAHQKGDIIVHVPKERVVFSGDIVFQECTPVGWVGTYENWLRALETIHELNPDVIVPGHGPVCDLDGANQIKSYLKYVREEAKKCFDQGLTAIEASKQIDFGDYSNWYCPSRIYGNVERAYREFRNQPFDAPWPIPKVLDAIYQVARSRGLELGF